MIKSRSKVSVKEILFCDQKTGEYTDPTHVLIPRREKVQDWLMVFHRMSEAIAKDKEIGAEAHRVLWYVISHIDYENKLLVTQADVKKALEMQQPHVSRAFRLLVKKEILNEANKIGTSKIYYLNPNFGWKGSAKRLKERHQDDLERKTSKSPQREVKTPSSSNLGEVA